MTTDKTPTFALKLPDFYPIAITDYIVGLVILENTCFPFLFCFLQGLHRLFRVRQISSLASVTTLYTNISVGD